MITVISGGTGSAKFLEGVREILCEEDLTVIVNVGDNFEVFGLYICPDVDTVTYMFAGLLDEERGWGRREDTFNALANLSRLGVETWFRLGDKDLALHIYRTFHRRAGRGLAEVTQRISALLGVRAKILPASDSPVETRILTDNGLLHFQEFWVKREARDRVLGVVYVGAEQASPAPGVVEAIEKADGIIIAPANPVTSIGPILAIPGIKDALVKTSAKKVAVSPIVGGRPFSGPAGKLLEGIGVEVSSFGVAWLYRDFLDAIVIDFEDSALKGRINQLGVECILTDTAMASKDGRKRLAAKVVEILKRH
ncbi:MAG: 2-phospho-L-lactate transferase [Candidatus Bathyarchaeia archaeon]